jgi:hypothetical protein
VRLDSLALLPAVAAGVVLALLGDDPPVLLAVAAVVLFPLGITLATGRDEEPPALAPALLGAIAGAFLVVFLIRLAVAAPDWVDPLSTDCGGPSTGAQQLATWFAAVAFVLAAIPVAVAVAALAVRVTRTRALAGLPLTLAPYPFAVALAGIALIVASWATSC